MSAKATDTATMVPPAGESPCLPWGESSFSTLRSTGAVYVDKTALIHDLASQDGFYLLARPRRFGKSLLASALATLFRGEMAYFRDLAIEKLWQDHAYDVLHVDLSLFDGITDQAAFTARFNTCLEPAVRRIDPDFVLPGDSFPHILERMSEWLGARANNSLVILIDEYDTPLVTLLEEPAGGDVERFVRSSLSSFYKLLKQYSGKVRFLLQTGVTRIQHVNLFSGFNNLQDISLLPRYGALLGFTAEEIRRDFAPWLTRAAQVRKESEETIMTELARHYDGFCFDDDASVRVFAPWSVLSFFKRPQDGYGNYWCGTAGDPDLLRDCLRRRPQGQILDRDLLTYRADLRWDQLVMPAEDLATLTFEQLLYQAGYLTITSAGPMLAELAAPNEEVRHSLARLYAAVIWRDANVPSDLREDLAELLGTGTPEAIKTRLNAALRDLDYRVLTVGDEDTLRALFCILLDGARIPHLPEASGSLGREGLRIDLPGRHVCMELKFAREAKQAPALARKAHAQMEARRCGEYADGLPVLKLVVVYAEEPDRQLAVCEAHE